MIKPFIFLLQLAALLFLLSGCSLITRHHISPRPVALPQSYSLDTAANNPANRWWEEFDVPELNRLMGRAFSGNLSLKGAWARLNQANALAVREGAARYPELALAGNSSYEIQRTEEDTGGTVSGSSYGLGLAGSFELDLWGRIRAGHEAALLEAAAAREDVNAAAVTLAASVTDRWINIISQRMQRQLLEQQLKTNTTYLELVELRFRKSMVPALDVYQQKQVVEEVTAQLPLAAAREQLFTNELALLLGQAPGTIKVTGETLPVPQGIPAAGLPAQLLLNRPDVRAALARFNAADQRNIATRADRFPAISLTAGAGLGPGSLEALFSSWLLNLAGNLTAPVFDGNRRAAEADRTRALAEENMIRYWESILTAIKDVEDALIREARQREHLKGLERQIDAASNALEQAEERYIKGLNDYLPVLTQLLAVQRLERDMIQQQTLLLSYRIGLHRSLGGTWPTVAIRESNKLKG